MWQTETDKCNECKHCLGQNDVFVMCIECCEHHSCFEPKENKQDVVFTKIKKSPVVRIVKRRGG